MTSRTVRHCEELNRELDGLERRCRRDLDAFGNVTQVTPTDVAVTR